MPFIEVVHNRELGNIEPAHVSKYLAACAERGNQPQTISSNVKLLSGFFKWAIDMGYTERYPIRQAHRPRVPAPPPPRILSDAEWGRIEEAIEGLRYDRTKILARGAMAMLRYLGLRKGEILDAKVADLDLARWRLQVKGKGRKVRIMPIPHPARVPIVRLWEFAVAEGSSWLMPSRRAKRLGQTALHRMWKTLLSLAGLPASIRIHDARHSYAVGFIERGESLEVIRLLLGHASLQTTQVYVRALPRDRLMGEAVERRFRKEKEEDE